MTGGDIEQVESVISRMHKTADLKCQACGRKIHAGHSCYQITTEPGPVFLTCWECGESIMLYLGWGCPATFPTTPPYGGGLHSGSIVDGSSSPRANPARATTVKVFAE